MRKRDRNKRLRSKGNRLWKQICFLRDGRECMVKKHFPLLGGEKPVIHSDIMQVDHCVSRAYKDEFFNPRNGTVVCQNCNGYKHNDQFSVNRCIDEIVIEREGLPFYRSIVRRHRMQRASGNWSKTWWLEEQIENLQRTLKELQK